MSGNFHEVLEKFYKNLRKILKKFEEDFSEIVRTIIFIRQKELSLKNKLVKTGTGLEYEMTIAKKLIMICKYVVVAHVR